MTAHQTAGQLACQVIPTSQRHRAPGLCRLFQPERGAILLRAGQPGGCVGSDGVCRQIAVADIILQRPVVLVITGTAAIIDTHLPQLTGGAHVPMQHLPIDDDTGAHTRAKRQTDQILHPAARPQLPFRIGHAVGIIIHSGRQTGKLLQQTASRYIIPPGHIRQAVCHTGIMVHKSGKPHPHGLEVGVFHLQRLDALAHLPEHGLGRAEIHRRHRLRTFNDINSLHHGNLHGSTAHIHPDS